MPVLFFGVSRADLRKAVCRQANIRVFSPVAGLLFSCVSQGKLLHNLNLALTRRVIQCMERRTGNFGVFHKGSDLVSLGISFTVRRFLHFDKRFV
jgi:hypothetical protein